MPSKYTKVPRTKRWKDRKNTTQIKRKTGLAKVIQDIIKNKDWDGLKGEYSGLTKAEREKGIKKGDISRKGKGGGKVPNHWMRLWITPAKKGVHTKAFKDLMRVTGIAAEDLKNLFKKADEAKLKYKKEVVDPIKGLAVTDKNKINFLKLINEGADNIDDIAKQLNMSVAEANKIGQAMFKDVYASRMDVRGGKGQVLYLPKDEKGLQAVLDGLSNVDGLEKAEQRQITKLLVDAFPEKGGDQKLFQKYRKQIDDFYDLKGKLADEIVLDLDHPLSVNQINNLQKAGKLKGVGKEAKLFVEPLGAKLNQGMKGMLDTAYSTADAQGNTTKMKATTNLAKKLGLKMGTTGFISKPFYKQHLGKTILENIEQQNLIAKNLENITRQDIKGVYPDPRSKLATVDPVSPESFERIKGILNDFYENRADPKEQKILEDTVNEIAGRKICRDGCFIKVQKANPGLMERVFQKLSGKGGRIGALVAGAGALGLGTGAMMADAEAEEPMTIDPWEQEGWEREQDPMRYNATEGRFTRLDGEPVNQQGVLNWIADNPVKSSFAAFPLAYGLGQGANKMGAQRAARFLKGWRAMIPAMMIPEGLTRTREGEGWGELATDPWNAIWALGWDSEASLRQKTQYYKQLAKQTGMTVDDVSLSMKNLKPSNWKKLPTALKNAVMSPRSAGSRMIFPYGRGMSKAVATRAGIGALGRVGAMMAVPIPGARVVGGLMALNELRKKYQFNKDVGAYVDQMRATGHLSEEDADTLRTVYKQGWLGTTGLGAKLLNSEVLQLEGKDIGVEEQARILDSMKLWQDEFREGRREVRSKQREPFFQSFSEGGRVEFAGGGMDRRSFLKWLAALTAGGMGMLKHGWKTPAKQITKEVAKETLTTAKPEMWVPRLIAKIKAEGKLLEMADKKYVHGDIYEVMINGKKVTLEYNPVTKRSQIDWDAPDYDSEMKRSIDYDEGQMIEEGKFAGTREKPEVNFLEPDRSTPYRDDFDNFDWINDSDQVLDDMQKWIGIEDVNPKPTGPRTSNFDFEDGGYDEFNQGGEVETGNIARRPGEVPPLSGPTPQGEGIVGLFSQPKQVRIG